jgi:DNA-binding transcriptional LysR family regulator
MLCELDISKSEVYDRNMQLESLKVFCDIGRLASFSRAAAENHLSQSAASQIVHQLEKQLGAQLIDRSERPLKLTAVGKAFAEGCKAILERYAELEASVRDAAHQAASTVRVAAIYSVGLGDMGEYIERFSTQYPQARIQMEYLHPDRVYERVLDGIVDLGLVSFPRKSRELKVLPWREEEMVLVCPPSHLLANQACVRPAELDGQKYIGFDRHLVIRREVDRFLRENGVSVDVSLEFDNVETIKKAIEVSAGIALLPEPTVRREVQAATLVALHLTGCRLVRPLGILHRRHHRLGSMAHRFVALLAHTDSKSPSASANALGPRRRKSSRRRVNHASHSRNGGASTRTI